MDNMSKKHFIELADCLKSIRPKQDEFATRANWKELYTEATSQWCHTVHELADFCQSQNNAFMRDRWMGYINGECGKNGGKVTR